MVARYKALKWEDGFNQPDWAQVVSGLGCGDCIPRDFRAAGRFSIGTLLERALSLSDATHFGTGECKLNFLSIA